MSIVPDYSLPVVEVYRRVTLFPIENLPNLSVLSYFGDRSVPSWVFHPGFLISVRALLDQLMQPGMILKSFAVAC
jgi:hypothetical protein